MPGYNKGTAGAKPGIQVWRIEKMDVVEQDAKTHGQFFSGDCYIVMKVSASGLSTRLITAVLAVFAVTQTKEDRPGGSRSYDLHYWLGKDCSQVS
jgi:gelsolin